MKPRTHVAHDDGQRRLVVLIDVDNAKSVLDARVQFPDAMFADLYDPLSMPPALAHAALDKTVDAAYQAAEEAAGRKPPKLRGDAERVAFLFERCEALTSLLPAARPKRARKQRVLA